MGKYGFNKNEIRKTIVTMVDKDGFHREINVNSSDEIGFLPTPTVDGAALISVNGKWTQQPGYGYSSDDENVTIDPDLIPTQEIDPEDIQQSVSDWLDDHPEATTTVADGAISYEKLDSTLKGKSDTISQLSEEINSLKDTTFRVDRFDWTHGSLISLVNGTTESGNYSYNVSDFISLPELEGNTITFLARSVSETIASIAFYDQNKTYISGLRNESASVATEGAIPNGTRYVRMCSHDNGVQNAFFEVTAGRISVVETELTPVFCLKNFEWTHGNIMSITDGSIESGGYSHNTTDFIELPVLRNTSVTYIGRTTSDTVASVCFYDSLKRFISGVRSSSKTVPASGTVPNGAVYFRMCSHDNGLENAFIRFTTDRLKAIETNIEKNKAEIDVRNLGNLIPDTATSTVGNVTFTRASYGHYILNGTSNSGVTLGLIDSPTTLPRGFEVGRKYILKFFTTSLDIYPLVWGKKSNGSSTKLNTHASVGCEFTITDDFVGIVVQLSTVETPTFNNDHVEIAIYHAESYAGIAAKKYVWKPRPMLSICDDDGYTNFYTDILPLIKETGVPIASANTTLRTEMREATDALYDARTKYAGGQITAEELAEVEAHFNAVRTEDYATDKAENYGLSFMSWSELQECSKYGAEIVCHTYGHFLNAEDMQMSDEVVRGHYLKAKHALELHGIPSDVVVYNGQANGYLKTRASASYAFKYGIRAEGEALNHVGGDPMQILRYGVGSEQVPFTSEDLIDLVSQLQSIDSGWMILNIHSSSNDWGSDKVGVLRDVFDYCHDHNIPIVTLGAAARWYYELGYQYGAVKYNESQIMANDN